MKIAIRADGGSQIGMGHIMRTLVLAKELAKTNDIFYVCRIDYLTSNKYKPGIDKIKSEGFNVVTIKEGIFVEELCKVNADCLITDSYDVNEEYFNITKKFFKVTGYIDDMNLYYFNVNFIINQNIGAEKCFYKVNKNTKLFLGTEYTMLREEFRNIQKKVINPQIADIMITVGGSDSEGLTNIICNYIQELEFRFHVVIGPSFEEDNIKELIILSEKTKNVNLYFNANMVKLMKKCDIAISACGSTLYEFAACGVPIIGIVLADNQKEVAINLQSKGAIEYLGWYDELNKEVLCNAILELNKNINKRRKMSKKSTCIVDGRGAERITNVLNKVFGIKKV
ncbi:UDP-2,4-diacetamido-2,4,6-trideoxy-beta-L-altropyranose hydrolase [Clostridium sp. CMCC3677]|uniref:UDP-2,4-diacetamido-2,4, 6-trideoxy-beta-L-altropyranose hydrolase n=1 Tax=Clostridium sp. CMCC3677 TaxID=2949963 RepID=UPI0013F0BE29|nr:UDP-2,4-diacetamido-2,4,6-trideoxy-beta-L-altropyranose hydrolase [Clostridium botulinum]NFQ10582.1 UDP-2,4-diacetamido-2,4,6-trideoxy-beta-L-altropyranose hydrolase [Clostridium botulinum]